jgi:hypothetical protein
MPPKGRSVDDLPLAAYLTGVDPETEPIMDEPPEANATEQAAAIATASGPAHVVVPVGDGSATTPDGERPPFAELLRNPRANARDPRLLLSGVIGIGVVLLALSLLGGGGAKGPAVANASPSAPAAVVATAAPAGDASVEVTGALTGTYALTGVTGTGHPGGASMESSWGDPLGDVLALGGTVSAGTRTTATDFVLSWTLMVDGKTVTFTSKAGECTVGMAVKPSTVSGSFTCHKVRSADGKLVVGATGTYRT